MQTSAEEQEDCPEINEVKAGGGIGCFSAEMVSANVGECGWIYEEMMMLTSMEGRRWHSPFPKQQLCTKD